MKEYNKSNIPLAKELRKNMTDEERKLWYLFLQKFPVRFQRQKSIGRYIVDFYCAKAQLVIELDGGGHFTDEQEIYDKERTNYLNSVGISVLRYTNLEIQRSFKSVCEDIDNTVTSLLEGK
ncbi:MAG: endonuclease domain-containing protein [Clostridia bacterium]|nr:endonuclease domain-containing protein [Clostridia bacterium]